MLADRVVADRYTLIRPIGRGAHAVVHAAFDVLRDRHVAVKLVPAHAGLGADELTRFVEAARAPSAIEDPGILDLIDAGLAAADLYLVAPLLHGATLRDLLRGAARMPLEVKLDILDGALAPLSVAHQRGFVHGDLTPSNVFVSRPRAGGERVVLLDLGLSAFFRAHPMLVEGASPGAPHAMAPEVLSGESAPTPASDVWSFGVLLYECLTGRRPFEHDLPRGLLHHVCHQDHELADVVNPEIGDSMARLVDMCLEKNPARRPPDGRALLRLFKSLRAGLGELDRASRHAGIPLDTVLDTGGAAPAPPPERLAHALRETPRDPEVHRALGAYYREVGNPDGAWLAAAAVDFLGEARRDEVRTHRLHQRTADRPFERGLDAPAWASLLHPDQDPRIDAIWTALMPALDAHLRETDETLGLAHMERVELGRPNDPLARTFARAVTAIRPGVLPRLYRGRSGRAPRHLPSHPPSSVFPTGFDEPLPDAALAFAVGRHVAYLRSPHRAVVLAHQHGQLQALFDAGRAIDSSSPGASTSTRLGAELGLHLDDARVTSLREAARQLGEEPVDLGMWRRAVELSCARAGLVLASDLEGTAWMLRWTRERPPISVEATMDDLLSFWTSGAHTRIRHLLGLAVTSALRVLRA